MTATARCQDPVGGTERRSGCCRGSLRRSSRRWCPFGRCRPQHPGASSRSRASGADTGAGGTAPAAGAGRRLRPLRPPAPGRLMERTEVLELMTQLKLYGMRAAYDEVMTAGIKRRHEPPRILGDLLAAEIAEKRARSIRYQLTIAKLPLPRMSTTSTSPARRSTRG